MQPEEILHRHHLRKTPARLSIVKCLQESKFPPSENDIRIKLRETYDRITFYRSVQTLMDAGVIHRIVADNTVIRYALNPCTFNLHVHENNHIHFYCTRCQTVECLDEIPIPAYPLPRGYERETCDVVVKGLCKRCTQKNDNKKYRSKYPHK